MERVAHRHTLAKLVCAMKRNDIVIRSVIFACVAASSLWILTSLLRIPTHPWIYSGTFYPQAGVSLFWEPGAVRVQVDGREEKVALSNLAQSAIYQEAISRIPRDQRPATTRILWPRLFRLWIPITVAAWLLLFRAWQPLRPYIEGERVR